MAQLEKFSIEKNKKKIGSIFWDLDTRWAPLAQHIQYIAMQYY